MISEFYFSLCPYLCGTAAELMQADVPIANLMRFDAGCNNPKQAKQLLLLMTFTQACSDTI